MKKCCFLIGHRDTPESVLPILRTTLERYVKEYGVTEFVVGHYGNFDRFAITILQEIKGQYPYLSIILLLPYHPAKHTIKLPEGIDESWYPEQIMGVPLRAAILSANRAAVECANYLIAYVSHPSNGARTILEYALHRERQGLIQVENLAER